MLCLFQPLNHGRTLWCPWQQGSPAGRLHTSLMKRLRILTDIPETLAEQQECHCTAWMMQNHLPIHTCTHTYTQTHAVLSHRPARSSSTLILITVLTSSTLPHPILSFPLLHSTDWGSLYLKHNTLNTIQREEGSSWQLFPALCAPSPRLLPSAEVYP